MLGILSSFKKTAVTMLFNLHRSLHVGSVSFDAFISEEHSRTLKLTEIPIEDGSVITDHSILEPKKLFIRAVLSETPIGEKDGVSSAFGSGLGGFISGGVAGGINSLLNDGASAITGSGATIGWGSLVEVLESREPLSIVTLFEKYDNMVLVNISTITDKELSKVLAVDLIFQEVRIVSTEESMVSVDKVENEDTASKATPKKSMGKKPTTKVAPTNVVGKGQSTDSWSLLRDMGQEYIGSE